MPLKYLKPPGMPSLGPSALVVHHGIKMNHTKKGCVCVCVYVKSHNKSDIPSPWPYIFYFYCHIFPNIFYSFLEWSHRLCPIEGEGIIQDCECQNVGIIGGQLRVCPWYLNTSKFCSSDVARADPHPQTPELHPRPQIPLMPQHFSAYSELHPSPQVATICIYIWYVWILKPTHLLVTSQCWQNTLTVHLTFRSTSLSEQEPAGLLGFGAAWTANSGFQITEAHLGVEGTGSERVRRFSWPQTLNSWLLAERWDWKREGVEPL